MGSSLPGLRFARLNQAFLFQLKYLIQELIPFILIQKKSKQDESSSSSSDTNSFSNSSSSSTKVTRQTKRSRRLKKKTKTTQKTTKKTSPSESLNSKETTEPRKFLNHFQHNLAPPASQKILTMSRQNWSSKGSLNT